MSDEFFTVGALYRVRATFGSPGGDVFEEGDRLIFQWKSSSMYDDASDLFFRDLNGSDHRWTTSFVVPVEEAAARFEQLGVPDIVEASGQGDLKKVEQILKEAPADPVPAGAAFRRALAANQDSTLLHLIQSGAIDASDYDELLSEAVRAGHAPAIEALIKAGANPNGSPPGQPPIVTATTFGEVQVARVLLAHGADPAPAMPGTMEGAKQAGSWGRKQRKMLKLLRAASTRTGQAAPSCAPGIVAASMVPLLMVPLIYLGFCMPQTQVDDFFPTRQLLLQEAVTRPFPVGWNQRVRIRFSTSALNARVEYRLRMVAANGTQVIPDLTGSVYSGDVNYDPARRNRLGRILRPPQNRLETRHTIRDVRVPHAGPVRIRVFVTRAQLSVATGDSICRIAVTHSEDDRHYWLFALMWAWGSLALVRHRIRRWVRMTCWAVLALATPLCLVLLFFY